MNPRGLRRYIDDLLRGRRPKPFYPDDFEAAQIRTAIDLQAARLGGDAPRQEFLTDLRNRVAAQNHTIENGRRLSRVRPAGTSSSARPRPRLLRSRRYRLIER